MSIKPDIQTTQTIYFVQHERNTKNMYKTSRFEEVALAHTPQQQWYASHNSIS